MRKSFNELLREERKLIGSIVHIPATELVEILGYAGYDLVLIDTEHTPFGMETAQQLVLAAQAVDMCPIIRVPEITEANVKKALDAGASGVIFPDIETADQARRAVSYAKYAPLGTRGACLNVRSAHYSLMGKDHFSNANEETSSIMLVESLKGFDNMEDILAVEGVDAVFLGPYDLSVSMGLAGMVHSKEVLDVLKAMMRRSHSCGVPVGIYERDLDMAKEWLNLGIDYVFYETDVSFIADCYKANLERISEAVHA